MRFASCQTLTYSPSLSKPRIFSSVAQSSLFTGSLDSIAGCKGRPTPCHVVCAITNSQHLILTWEMMPTARTSSDSGGTTKTSSRQMVLAACHMCRARKTACDGGRPTCRNCNARSHTCVYDTKSANETRTAAYKRRLQDRDRRLTIIESFLNRMRASQDDELLNLLRHSASNTQLLNTLTGHGNDALRESPSIPPRMLMHAESPSTISPFEQELVVSHPKAYSMPLSVLAQVRERLPNTFEENSERPISDGVLSHIDPRLDELHMYNWTLISIPDDIARRMLSLYLRTDHQILGLFDADFVIDELVELRMQFCSPHLVSSLFFWICVRQLVLSFPYQANTVRSKITDGLIPRLLCGADFSTRRLSICG